MSPTLEVVDGPLLNIGLWFGCHKTKSFFKNQNITCTISPNYAQSYKLQILCTCAMSNNVLETAEQKQKTGRKEEGNVTYFL